MVRLLLTHGRGLRGRDKARLRARFTRYLREGLDAAGYREVDDNEIDFLYYGDILERPVVSPPEPAVAALAEADRAMEAGVATTGFDVELDALQRRLDDAGAADARVCNLVEERAERQPSVTGDTDEEQRRAALDTAIEDRTSQLLDDPAELLDVLKREFGPDFTDDATVRRGLQDLDARLGVNPKDSATRRAVDEEQSEDPDSVDTLLREWIIDPVTDAVAGLRAVRRIVETYGVDVRHRLGDWRAARWSDLLTRLEKTDFGQQWAALFDILAVIADKSALDGLYIARRMVDVEHYLRDMTVRGGVRAYFHDALEGRDEPTIMIAHSLGSVVAYDVLREFPDLYVPGLVTLGSPLSIGHFRRNLARDGEEADDLPVPGMLDRWVNVYSELDPLTLGSGIEAFFQGGGDEQGRGPVDREAENHGYLDAHSPDQYLRAKVTSAAIIHMVASATVDAGA